MTVYLWVGGHFPGMNEIVAAAKGAGGSGAGYARMKRSWTETVCWTARAAKLPQLTGAVRLGFLWHEKDRRRDPDNLAAAKKFLNDGLVMAKVIEGDGWDHIAGFSDDWVVDKMVGVRVQITEVS